MLSAEFGRSTSNGIDIEVKPKIGDSWSTAPRDEGVTVTSFPRMLVMLLRFTTKGVHIMESPKLGDAGALPTYNGGVAHADP